MKRNPEKEMSDVKNCEVRIAFTDGGATTEKAASSYCQITIADSTPTGGDLTVDRNVGFISRCFRSKAGGNISVNRAESAALEWIIKSANLADDVERIIFLFTDSQNAINILNSRLRRKSISISDNVEVRVFYIPSHKSLLYNHIADSLATRVLKSNGDKVDIHATFSKEIDLDVALIISNIEPDLRAINGFVEREFIPNKKDRRDELYKVLEQFREYVKTELESHEEGDEEFKSRFIDESLTSLVTNNF